MRNCAVMNCDRPFYAKTFCKLHYRRDSKHGDPLITLISHHSHESKVHLMRERFKSKFVKNWLTKCWDWKGSKDKAGYGVFNLHIGKCEYKKMRANRLSYEFYVGKIEDNKFVCHSCDNPGCVNPNHLYQGTQKENLKEMSIKGRSLHGEKNPKSKFRYKDVELIRQKLNSGQCTMAQLAKFYKVNLSTIKRIKYYKSYANKDCYANRYSKKEQGVRYRSK